MQFPKWLLTIALACCAPVDAQTTAKGLAGDWEGALEAGGSRLRLELHVTHADDGLYLGRIDSLDQGSVIPFDKATVDGRDVKIEWRAINATYAAKLSEDGTKLEGTWSQGMPMALVLTRKTAAPPAAEAPKAPQPTAGRGLDAPIDVQVPAPPMPFVGGGGRSHLAYELHIVNFRPADVLVTRIEVLGDADTLASFEGPDLVRILSRPGMPGADDARKIGPGQLQIAWMWVTLEPDVKTPQKLRHKLTVDGAAVELDALAVSAEKPIVVGPPLKGGVWMAANGPGNASGHRRAMIPIGGQAHIAQRFAIDWLKLDDTGKNLNGDPKDNKSYNAYGAEVLAVADAVVAATKDGIPENVPGPASRAVPITLETVGGNHIVLDLGGGRYGFYAHLQPGSLRVKPGDRVKRGQVLGLLGNSTNSTEPHLHFQVMNGSSPLGSEGLPYALDSFETLAGANPGKKENALPMQNARVRFAQ